MSLSFYFPVSISVCLFCSSRSPHFCVSLTFSFAMSNTAPRHRLFTHTHINTLHHACCCDEIKHTQDLKINSHDHSQILSHLRSPVRLAMTSVCESKNQTSRVDVTWHDARELAYLQSNWNRLDFAIVLLNFFSLVLSSFRFLKVLRLARALRPFRLVQR